MVVYVVFTGIFLNSSTSFVLQPANLWRRLMSLAYESLLLFGVTFAGMFCYMLVVRPANQAHFQGLTLVYFQLYMAIVYGAYFVYCWRKSGQTLAMKTWGLKLVDASTGKKISWMQGVVRTICAWGWVLPAIIVYLLTPVGQYSQYLILSFVLSPLCWALTFLLSSKQLFLHDVIANTMLVTCDYSQKH